MIVMLFSVAAVTNIFADDEVMSLNDAVIVVLPDSTPETNPILFTEAVVGSTETQLAIEVRSAVDPSS